MPAPPRLEARLVIFDLDGVVYRGSEAIPGSAELVNALHRDSRLVRFATNNSMATRQEYVARLGRHGITTSPDEIVTSTSATVEHLQRHLPTIHRVLAVGAAGMLAELRAAGLHARHAQDAAPQDWSGGPLTDRYDAVVAGLDPEVDYRRLGIAAVAIRAGATFIATNADVRYPTPEGFMPGAGAIVAALQAASGTSPLIIGKPEPAMFTAILEQAAVGPGEALVIGDNPDSDIIAARRAGIASVLVMTGIADAEQVSALDGERRPDHCADDPAGVARLLGLKLS